VPGLAADEHALIEAQTVPFYVGNRTRSTALLAWFIEHVMREDPDAVEDAICDGGGDKGIDALVLDEDANELFVLQAKHRRKAGVTQGDGDLRSFSGVAAYFANADGVQSLLDSAPNEELINLVGRLDLARRLEESAPHVRLIFVTNAERDIAGVDYLAMVGNKSPSIELWDGPRLLEVARRTERADLLSGEYTLSSAGVISKALSDDTRMAVAMIPATELIRLPGIENLTIFDLNVRLGLGNTKINRELRQTIRTQAEHPLFPAYHNGLTLLTGGLAHDGEDLLLDGVGVVNGCQSLLALWRGREYLSPDLILIVKVIELAQRADLADMVTYRSNNQNPVNMRDQRANDRIQRDLQKEVSDRYGDALFYDVRRGQPSGDAESQLDNQLAAQLLMAVWVGEPWNAVRKVKLFDQEYHRVFRKANADRLFLASLINDAIQARKNQLRVELQTSFASVRFALAHLVAVFLRQSTLGERLLESPGDWLPDQLDGIRKEFDRHAEFVIDETNYFIQERVEAAQEVDAPPFDPKTIFKSANGVRQLERQVVQAVKALARRPNSDVLFDTDPTDDAP
jgi:hypothetical protein